MSENESLYEKLGVDATKENVKGTFKSIIDNEYPGAFVNIITDPFDKNRAMTQHQDGDGSKFIQRLLDYYVNGNPLVFRGMVDDALSMNTGDIAASGFVFQPWLITDVLNISLPKDLKEIVMQQIAIRFKELFELYSSYGFQIKFLGGETADLPDQVRSGVFDVAITAWADKRHLIKGNVQPGDLIFGFQSDGQAVWEDKPNSGLMSNGLTSARTVLMHEKYNQKYPNCFGKNEYCGRYEVNEVVHPSLGMTVGEALISPTRQWAIVIRLLMEELLAADALHLLHGIVMNTGGGATKIKNIGSNIRYIKDMRHAPLPPFFQLIQKESAETWPNMYKSFNCGIGLDVVGEDNPLLIDILYKIAKKVHLQIYHLGYCGTSLVYDNELVLQTPLVSTYY